MIFPVCRDIIKMVQNVHLVLWAKVVQVVQMLNILCGMVKNVFVLKVLVMAELVWIREFVVRNMLFVVKKLNVN